MTWICDDCGDELLFEESRCSCEEWDLDRLIKHIHSLNARVRELKKKVNQLEETCDDCGRRDGHDASCFYHGPY